MEEKAKSNDFKKKTFLLIAILVCMYLCVYLVPQRKVDLTVLRNRDTSTVPVAYGVPIMVLVLAGPMSYSTVNCTTWYQ